MLRASSPSAGTAKLNPDPAGSPGVEMVEVAPYSVLADIYDDVMSHVEYDRWARLAVDLLMEAGLPPPESGGTELLECACGTGTVAGLLASYGYRVEACDSSPEMLKLAAVKSAGLQYPPDFKVLDFLSIDYRNRFEGALCLYDSINYLRHKGELRDFLTRVKRALKPGGIFLFDICTEMNSRLHFHNNSDDYRGRDYSYQRVMKYDARRRMQVNTFHFRLRREPEKIFVERHEQRIYPVEWIRSAALDAGFQVVRETDGFTRSPAHRGSLRIHFLCRRLT